MEDLNHRLSPKAVEDYKLVRKAIDEGDQKAYTSLMDRYKDSIYFLLMKMVNNKVDAEDLTIEAFGKAFKRLDQYTPTYAFSTWLFKIATNNCIDFIRRKKGRHYSLDKTVMDEEGTELNIDLESKQLDPEERIIREQKVKAMREVVKRLKPRYRELIELRYFKEYSYEEISEYLDLPLGTIKAQLFRAREFLYHILKNTREKI